MTGMYRPSPGRLRLVSAASMLVVLALLAAACGSTAQIGAGGRSGAPGGALANEAGLGAPADTWDQVDDESLAADAPIGATGAGDTPAQGPVAGDSRGGAPSGPARESTGGRQAAPTGPVPPGGADGERPAVQVGVYVIENSEEFFESLGADIAVGDGRRQAGAIIADINERGGLAGHPIEPVFAARNAQSSESHASQDQRACSTWTEDNHVVAAVSAINTTDVLLRCLSDRRIPFVASNAVGWTAESFAAAPYFVGPAMLNMTRMAPVYVDRLAAQGFFREDAGPTGPIFGLLRFDTPGFERVAREGIDPALARHGVRLSEEAAFTKPAGTSENGATVAQMQNAVLRFKTRGVTHVLALDETAFIGGVFLTAAESSAYRPRYGLTSYSVPAAIETLSPREQVKNVSGIDWYTIVSLQQEPPESAETERCDRIMRDAGEAEGIGAGYCETLFLLDAVADRSGTVQGPAWLAGLEAMGTAYRPIQTLATRFGPGRHDGVALVRDFDWNNDCSCFVYTSEPMPAD